MSVSEDYGNYTIDVYESSYIDMQGMNCEGWTYRMQNKNSGYLYELNDWHDSPIKALDAAKQKIRILNNGSK
jgi:hypothetical protein